MSELKKIVRGFERFSEWLGYLAYFICGAGAAFMVVGIFMRYILHSPLKSATDMEQIIMVLVTFLGSAYVLKIDGHVNVDIVFTWMSPRGKNILLGIGYLILGLPYCALLLYYIVPFVASSYRLGERTIGASILIWPAKGLMILGFLLLSIQLLITGIEMLQRGLKGGESNG